MWQNIILKAAMERKNKKEWSVWNQLLNILKYWISQLEKQKKKTRTLVQFDILQ